MTSPAPEPHIPASPRDDTPTEAYPAERTAPTGSAEPATPFENVSGPIDPPTTPTPRLRPRFGTIFWGILLLAVAAYVAVANLIPTPLDPTLWLLGGVIAIGLGLIVAGVAAAARRAG